MLLKNKELRGRGGGGPEFAIKISEITFCSSKISIAFYNKSLYVSNSENKWLAFITKIALYHSFFSVFESENMLLMEHK